MIALNPDSGSNLIMMYKAVLNQPNGYIVRTHLRTEGCPWLINVRYLVRSKLWKHVLLLIREISLGMTPERSCERALHISTLLTHRTD